MPEGPSLHLWQAVAVIAIALWVPFMVWFIWTKFRRK